MAMSKRSRNNHNTLRFSYPKQTESSQDEILSKEILEGRWKSQSVDYLEVEEDPLSLTTPTITTPDSPVKDEVENLITFPSQDEIDIELEVKVEQTERPEDYCDTIVEEDAEESPKDVAAYPVEVNLNLSESNEQIETPKKRKGVPPWVRRKRLPLRRQIGPKPKKRSSHFCVQCGNGFYSQSGLDDHKEQRGHFGDFPLLRNQCAYCFEVMKKRRELEAHEISHVGQTKYKCPQCPKEFDYANDLYYHKKSEHEMKYYRCSYCVKKFTYVSDLKYHQEEKHNFFPKPV